MIPVTPIEAGRKLCPFMTRAASGRPSTSGAINCEGPTCMAWKWKDDVSRGDDRRGVCQLLEPVQSSAI